MEKIYIIIAIEFADMYCDVTPYTDGRYHQYRVRTSPDQEVRHMIAHDRTVGWFSSYSEAELNVKNNNGDIHEEQFTHVVIEECYEGLYGGMYDCSKFWFVWDPGLKEYLKCDEPESEKSIIGYWS